MTRTLPIALVAALSSASASSADPAPPPPPVSLPWNLRPVAPSSTFRVDSTLGLFEDAGVRGETFVSMVSLSYKVLPTVAPIVRVGVIDNHPAMGAKAMAISNPVVGAIWGLPTPRLFKIGIFTALSIPAGSGGGDDGNPARLAAQKAAVFARSGMDNSAFAVNDLTPFLGIDVAIVHAGFTLQAEATLFENFRMRGKMVQSDVYKTNTTTGLHLGYFVAPWLCASAELRYQRYLLTPSVVRMDPANRDTLTIAGGVRAIVKLGGARVFRPGVSYARGLDDPMDRRDYQIVQLDLPFTF